MIIAYISIFFLLFSFGAFNISYQVNGMNRTIIATPLSLIETLILVGGEHDLKLYMPDVAQTLRDYYDKVLPKYCLEYDTMYQSYIFGNSQITSALYCDRFEYMISAKLAFNYQYRRVMYFEIMDNYGH